MHSYLSEFHEEAFRKGIRDEGFDEGFLNATIKFIHKSKSHGCSLENTITQIIEYFELSEEEATTLVNENWK